MSTANRKAQVTFFMMLKQFDPKQYERYRKAWLCKNKNHVKVYHRTNQRKNRAVQQKVSDRTRALQHLAKHIKLKLDSLGETLDKKTLARFNRAVLQT